MIAWRLAGAWRWALLGLFLLPLVWALLASVDIVPDGFRRFGAWQLDPTLAHYQEVLGESVGLAPATLTGLAVAAAATTLSVASGFAAAAGLRRLATSWSRRLGPALLLLYLLPVIAYGPPLADGARWLGLYDTLAGLVLVEAALTLPLAIWLLGGYLARLPRELDEAAALDGCSELAALWRVLLPAAWSGVAATAVVVFVLDWNLFEVPSLLSLTTVKTVPLVLSAFLTYERDLEWQPAAAALLVGLAPALLAVVAAHRALRTLAPLGGADEV